jgi:hypothetical protein
MSNSVYRIKEFTFYQKSVRLSGRKKPYWIIQGLFLLGPRRVALPQKERGGSWNTY